MIKRTRKDGFGAERGDANNSKGCESVTLDNQPSCRERRFNPTAYTSNRCCCSRSTESAKEKVAAGSRKLFIVAFYERWSTGEQGGK